MRAVQTVLGPVAPAELGPLTHSLVQPQGVGLYSKAGARPRDSLCHPCWRSRVAWPDPSPQSPASIHHSSLLPSFFSSSGERPTPRFAAQFPMLIQVSELLFSGGHFHAAG